MECQTCGHRHEPTSWSFNGEDAYAVQSNWISQEMIEHIGEHALSLEPPLTDIYIDTFQVDASECEACLLQHLRSGRDMAVQRLADKGLHIFYYF